MTVKELKDILSTVDDNLPVVVGYEVNDEYGGQVHINKENVTVETTGTLVTDGRDKDGKFIQHYEHYQALCIDFKA